MNITDVDVSRFQSLYKKYTGRSIDIEDARTKLSALVRQMELIYRPITEQDVRKNEDVDLYEPSPSEKNR